MAWIKVEKEKEDWTKVDKTEKGWLSGPWFFDWLSGAFRGIWNKVDKRDCGFLITPFLYEPGFLVRIDWTKVNKE